MNKEEFIETLMVAAVLLVVVVGLIFAVSPTKGEDTEAVVLGTRTGRLSTDYYVVVDAGSLGVVPIWVDAETYFNDLYHAGDKINVYCYKEVKFGPNTCRIED